MEIEKFNNVNEAFKLIKRWMWAIILLPLVISFFAGIVSYYFLEKTYDTKTSLYVVLRPNATIDNPNPNLTYQDLMASQLLIKDYKELVNQRFVVEQALKELKYDSVISYEEASNMIEVTLKNETRIMEIHVNNTDPIIAANLANSIAKIFSKKAVEILKMGSIQVIDEAFVPNTPNGPKTITIVFSTAITSLIFILGFAYLFDPIDKINRKKTNNNN